MTIIVHHGDSRDIIPTLGESAFDSCVCDPPYALTSIVKRFGADGAAAAKGGKTGAFKRASSGFMGKRWDTGETAFDPAFWRLVWTALKPGAYLIAFGGSRTYHRLACAIEDAGFIIHPLNGWVFGSGFPKASSLSKALDKDARGVLGKADPDSPMHGQYKGGCSPDNERGQGFGAGPGQYVNKGAPNCRTTSRPLSEEAEAWDGWSYGTQSQKPALEPICFAQKPISEKRMVDNIRRWGVGAVNVDGCRVEANGEVGGARSVEPREDRESWRITGGSTGNGATSALGRWPANLCLSVPEDEYELRPGVSAEKRRELFRWLHENA